MLKLSGVRGEKQGDENMHGHDLTEKERKCDTRRYEKESDAGNVEGKTCSVTSETLKVVTRVLVAPVTRASLTSKADKMNQDDERQGESEELVREDQVTIETNVSPIELMWRERSSCTRRRVKRREEEENSDVERKSEINEEEEEDGEENQVNIQVTKFKATEGESAHEADEKASDLKVICRDKEEPLHPQETMDKVTSESEKCDQVSDAVSADEADQGDHEDADEIDEEDLAALRDLRKAIYSRQELPAFPGILRTLVTLISSPILKIILCILLSRWLRDRWRAMDEEKLNEK